MGIIKDPTSWRVGFELGLAGFSFPYSKPRNPTAYLYNGIRLPALPEWDRGVYPYVFIYLYQYDGNPDNSQYVLEYTENRVAVGENKALLYTTGSRLSYELVASDGSPTISSDGSWVFDKEYDADTYSTWYFSIGNYRRTPIWANHNIDNPDGTVYLAASDPVPVYE